MFKHLSRDDEPTAPLHSGGLTPHLFGAASPCDRGTARMGQARKVTFTRESSKRIKSSEESHSDPNENLPMKNRKLEAALRGMGTSQETIVST